MCDAVCFNGKWHNTPAELAELIGGADKIIWRPEDPFRNRPAGADWGAMDLCLCPIDLAETLANAGFKWTRGADPMEWLITCTSPQTGA